MKRVLLIGSGDTSYGLNQIIKQDSITKAESLYGADSPVVRAYRYSLNSNNAETYIANVLSKKDFLSIMSSTRHFNFDFVVPIGVKFSDTGKDLLTDKTLSFTELFLNHVSDVSDSVILMTDNHASLYEDIDSFLIDMFRKIREFKSNLNQSTKSYLRQLLFVANMLDGIDYSNAYLAYILCDTQIGNYPDHDFPKSVFDMHPEDVKNYELICFQNNIRANNSVENFKNFHPENNAYKVAPIDFVIRQINKEVDLTSMRGRLLNATTKLKIKSMLEEYLESIKNIMIRDYKVIDIRITTNSDYTYTIICLFKILPINSLESCEILIEVQ